jgi:hypothetical protein
VTRAQRLRIRDPAQRNNRLRDVDIAAGGGLLKFGDDALLLFFTGEIHSARGHRVRAYALTPRLVSEAASSSAAISLSDYS